MVTGFSIICFPSAICLLIACLSHTGACACAGRSLSEQLFGSDAEHARLRHEAVAYMRQNEDEFAPFLEEDVSFQRHSEWRALCAAAAVAL